MRKLILVPLIALVAGLTACGSSETTTVVEKQTPVTTTSTDTSTTDVASEEWPQSLQNAFIKGCGSGHTCYCELDELMQAIPTEEVIASQNLVAEYRDEMHQAVESCL